MGRAIRGQRRVRDSDSDLVGGSAAPAQSGAPGIHRGGGSAAKCAGAALLAHSACSSATAPENRLGHAKRAGRLGHRLERNTKVLRSENVWILNCPKSIWPFRTWCTSGSTRRFPRAGRENL